MHIEFRPVDLSDKKEVRALIDLDRRIFSGSDYGDTPVYWKDAKAFWIIVKGEIVGSVAFWHNARFTDGENWDSVPGWLYFGSLGLLQEFRGLGIGTEAKKWQIEYARKNGFTHISTNHRKSSVAAIHLNQKFGFTIVGTMDGYWEDPVEPNIILELAL